MTLSGREAPSSKRIDVEANLLEEWLLERRETKKQIQLRVVAVAGVAFLGFWGVSGLNSWRAAYAAKQKPVEQRLKAILGQYAAIVPSNSGTSQADIDKLVASTKAHGDAFMGQIITLMNNATPEMAFSTLKVDVLGGEVKMSGQADAENYLSANDFINRNNDPTKGMTATQLSTSRSDLLATDGVSFQFVKKARVSQ